MRRRDFLSMLSCAALAAVVPRKTYYFLNGLWRPRYGISPIESLRAEMHVMCMLAGDRRDADVERTVATIRRWPASANPRPWRSN